MAYAKGENDTPGHQVKVAPCVFEGAPARKTECGGESVPLPRILDNAALEACVLSHLMPPRF